MKESAPVTRLRPTDVLALTCTRAGTCCHGKAVWLHPYEVARLARGRGMTPRDFADRHSEGGIRLKFDGPPGYRGLPACSQYDPAAGCRAHADRPLACRLYPLGRERQGTEIRYVHDGKILPCFAGCPDVAHLPQLTVADYLAGQDVPAWTVIQEAYLEMTQDLGEAAFVLALETGLPGPALATLWQRWAAIAELDHIARAAVIPADLGAVLILPDLDPTDPAVFVAAHRDKVQDAMQTFANDAVADGPDRDRNVAAASATAFALALHLGQAVGAAPAALSAHWLETARNAAFNRGEETP